WCPVKYGQNKRSLTRSVARDRHIRVLGHCSVTASICLSRLFRWRRTDAIILLPRTSTGSSRLQPTSLAVRSAISPSVLHRGPYPNCRLSLHCSQTQQSSHSPSQCSFVCAGFARSDIRRRGCVGCGQYRLANEWDVLWWRSCYVHPISGCRLTVSHHFCGICSFHREMAHASA